MKAMRRILVGLDLGSRGVSVTPGSLVAAEQALWLAPQLGAQVTLLHSTATDESWDEAEHDYLIVPEGVTAAGRDALEAVAERFRAKNIPVELALSEEKAWLAIVRCVLRERIDLVIVGKRSSDGAKEHRIGSVAMKLLRKCPCAVWVIKQDGSARPRRILAATDLSDAGRRAVEYAAYVADRCGAELHLVHAIQLPFSTQFEGAEGEQEFERRESRAAIEKLRQQLAAVSFQGEPAFHVGVTAPTRAILGCADRIDPDLVVMGTVSRGGLAGVIVGNTAERVLGRLDCSLLTVKPSDFICPVTLD
jgi:universal stress protein E